MKTHTHTPIQNTFILFVFAFCVFVFILLLFIIYSKKLTHIFVQRFNSLKLRTFSFEPILFNANFHADVRYLFRSVSILSSHIKTFGHSFGRVFRYSLVSFAVGNKRTRQCSPTSSWSNVQFYFPSNLFGSFFSLIFQTISIPLHSFFDRFLFSLLFSLFISFSLSIKIVHSSIEIYFQY